MRIIFFGTPDFAASVLSHFVQHTPHEVVAVVSKPDNPKGRGRHVIPTPVKVVAQTLLPKVPVLQPEKASAPEVVEQLRSFAPDVCVVVAYGEIIRQTLLDIAPMGFFNTHASLLPSYRGAAPIQRALMDGCEKTGVTIFRLNKGMDSGDIIWQQSCQVGPNMNEEELSKELLRLSCNGVVEFLAQLEAGTAVLVPQHHEEATLAPKIAPEDLVLDQSLDVYSLHDRIRALSLYHGAFFWVTYREKRLRFKVLRTHIDLSVTAPHRRWQETEDGGLALATPEGVLVFDQVQLEGRASMDSSSFLRGVPLKQLLFC